MKELDQLAAKHNRQAEMQSQFIDDRTSNDKDVKVSLSKDQWSIITNMLSLHAWYNDTNTHDIIDEIECQAGLKGLTI